MDQQARSLPKARTVLAQALGAVDADSGELVPPVHVSATYMRDADNGYASGRVYGRSDNATVRQVEEILATLEGADEALLFGSGMSAATSVFSGFDRPTHVVASEVMYWGFRQWLGEAHRLGRHDVTFVETSDPDAVARAMRPGETGIVWIETPSNPLWSITDIEAIGHIAHAAGALLCVDSTVSTPLITRPIAFGADLVVHSATKYLNGHSDVIAGAIATATDSALWQNICRHRRSVGAIVGPFEAWLLLRGMRTLDVRLREQCRSAAMLAERLSHHDAVASVLYPGLESHPGHAIARRQMDGLFGGMLSLRLKGGEAAALEAISKVMVWKRATSFGGVESLIEHRASIEGQGTPCPNDLLRLSAGLEDPDDLYLDLVRAFN